MTAARVSHSSATSRAATTWRSPASRSWAYTRTLVSTKTLSLMESLAVETASSEVKTASQELEGVAPRGLVGVLRPHGFLDLGRDQGPDRRAALGRKHLRFPDDRSIQLDRKVLFRIHLARLHARDV